MPRVRLSPLQIVVVGVVGIIACWLLATPRYAGPDEPSHAVASAALARGHRTSSTGNDLGYFFMLPAMVGDPENGCFAFQPSVPASCAGEPTNTVSTAQRLSTAWGYPIWGHVLPGLVSFLAFPRWYLYLARLASAVIPMGVAVAALRRARQYGAWMFTAALAGITPIAWFTMAVLNPSALSMAGGLALWIAILVAKERGDWLLVAGWLALTLPRRDGPMWAVLVVLFACIAIRSTPGALFRRLRWPQRVVVLVSLPLPLIPSIMFYSDTFNTALALAPIGLLAVEGAATLWRRIGPARINPRLTLAMVGAAPIAALAGANLIRSDGIDTAATWQMVASTGEHLRQIVGELGWLDTPAPDSAMFLWWAVLGGLALVALLASPRAVAVAACTLGAGIVLAWVLQLSQHGGTLVAWQGRYSVPFLLGVPMVLAAGIDVPAISARRAQLAVRGSVWFVWNLTFYAAMRRWGAGVNGVVYPWRWGDWGSPLPPLVFIVLHAGFSGLLMSCDMRPDPQPLATADILDES